MSNSNEANVANDLNNNGNLNSEAVNTTTPVNRSIKSQGPSVSFITRSAVYQNIGQPKKRGLPYLTEYEKTRLICTRTEQLKQGAQPVVDYSKLPVQNELTIAKLELQEKKIPIIIARHMPDGTTDYYEISELLQL